MLDMCKKYDKDGNGTIEFEEFLEMSKVRRSHDLALFYKRSIGAVGLHIVESVAILTSPLSLRSSWR
jgi:hypothetical protein